MFLFVVLVDVEKEKGNNLGKSKGPAFSSTESFGAATAWGHGAGGLMWGLGTEVQALQGQKNEQKHEESRKMRNSFQLK